MGKLAGGVQRPAQGREFRRRAQEHPGQAADAGYKAPKIFVSTKPAEIIVTDGAPSFKPVAGTGLQRVVNTSSVLFFDPAQDSFYVQLSGRWFSAHGLAGPWDFATNKLPPDFALISPDGPDAAVLASVPGTVQAQEAVLKAQIPTTATSSAATAKLTVVYSGPPHFVPIPGTTMLAAVNTNAEVLQIGTAYYACESGVWFVSTTPTGRGLLADSIPPAIHTIPPSSPYYNLTYVQVYAVTPVAVTYGYTAGYTLGYVSAGVLVYGTGYYYPPVIIPGPVPIYYPYPVHLRRCGLVQLQHRRLGARRHVYGPYGGAVAGGTYYNPNTGAWAHGGAVYGPNGGAGAWSAYNPSTGSYAHGSASWSNGSGSANASYYNARTGVSGSTNQNVNPYGRSGSSTFSGPNQTVNTQKRQQRQRPGRRLQFIDRSEGRGLPEQCDRQTAATSLKRKTAMCMPGMTATFTNIPIAAGRNTTTVAGTRCSRRRTTPAIRQRPIIGRIRRRRRNPVRATTAWRAATTSNWSRIGSDARAVREAGTGVVVVVVVVVVVAGVAAAAAAAREGAGAGSRSRLPHQAGHRAMRSVDGSTWHSRLCSWHQRRILDVGPLPARWGGSPHFKCDRSGVRIASGPPGAWSSPATTSKIPRPYSTR